MEINNCMKGVFNTILKDRTTGKNIIFAAGDNPAAEITIDDIKNINPRWQKPKEEQGKRTKKKAEVFTPSWICADMVSMGDAEWFGGKDPFCTIDINRDAKTWEPVDDQVTFPEGKTWEDYISRNTLEVTCGEAPFVCMRYDTGTGDNIDIHSRVGILDRKFRVVCENTCTEQDWLRGAVRALQSTYGYEWAGDNLLIARCNVMMSFVEWFRFKFGRDIPEKYLEIPANIVSWNFWQMDGLKNIVPLSDQDGEGIFAEIADWGTDTGKIIRFRDLLK